MQLRNKTPKRRVKAKLREDWQEAVGPNDVWAMDFVHDQLATGRKIRVLTVVDTFSRYSPALDARFSYRGEDVVATLERVCSRIGYPKTIRVDQGSEFISRDLDLWAYQRGVTLDFSRPGKPTDNAFIEAFNGRLRAECLNAHWFLSLADAAEKLEAWRRDYNEQRPHGAIGNKVPARGRWGGGRGGGGALRARADRSRRSTRIRSTVMQVADDLGIGLSSLTRWKRQYREADLLAGPHEDTAKELARLRKENELV